MGKQKYRKEIEALLAKSPVVHISSIAAIIEQKKRVRQYVKRCINVLLAAGKIKQLSKGWYTTRDDPSLAVFCFQPAYLGLQDALSMHNLWEQETIPIIVTVKKVRQGIRSILGKNVLIRRIKKEYYFGLTYIQHESVALPYTDVEKTLIDLVYFHQPISKVTLKTMKKKIDLKKLAIYIKNYPRTFQKKLNNLLRA